MKLTIPIELLCHHGDVFDVGAHIGNVSKFISKQVVPYKVFAFEPVPDNWADFETTTRACPNVELVKIALCDQLGVESFHTQVDNLNAGSLARTGLRPESWDIINVKTDTIDHFCEERRVTPSFIKIDVEGAEDLVLRGARQTLENCHPPLIIEMHTGVSLASPFYLEWLGYKMHVLHLTICGGVLAKEVPEMDVDSLLPISARDFLRSRIMAGPMVLDLLAIHETTAAAWDNIQPILSTKPGGDHLLRAAKLAKTITK